MSTNESEAEDLPPRWVYPRAAYMHIPFCAHHCCYCDFAVVAGRDDAVSQYLEAVAREMALIVSKRQSIDSLFVGGGTPTHLSPDQLNELFATLRRWFEFPSDVEISVEANPATLTAEKINTLADLGVNRISIGAQSFDSETLAFLERDHTSIDIARTIDLVRRRIDNVSLDLIFGVPVQSLDDWRRDLRMALDIRPAHLSTYGLTYEKGTRLWKQVRNGGVQPLNEQMEYDMYRAAMHELADAGYDQYEISNFALPGRCCRHNQTYWANEAYWGFGLGAARYVRCCRETNTRDLSGYIRKAMAGQSTVMQSETLDPRERARETMAIQLRRIEGINRDRFFAQTGLQIDDVAGPQIRRLVEMGLLGDDPFGVRLTQDGKFVADAVIAELMTARNVM